MSGWLGAASPAAGKLMRPEPCLEPEPLRGKSSGMHSNTALGTANTIAAMTDSHQPCADDPSCSASHPDGLDDLLLDPTLESCCRRDIQSERRKGRDDGCA